MQRQLLNILAMDVKEISWQKKVVHRRSSSCIYEVIKPTGERLIEPNLASAAKIVGVNFNTLKKRLDTEKLEGNYIEFHYYKIKRIAVFYSK